MDNCIVLDDVDFDEVENKASNLSTGDPTHQPTITTPNPQIPPKISSALRADIARRAPQQDVAQRAEGGGEKGGRAAAVAAGEASSDDASGLVWYPQPPALSLSAMGAQLVHLPRCVSGILLSFCVMWHVHVLRVYGEGVCM
jgi:hypothetical protein